MSEYKLVERPTDEGYETYIVKDDFGHNITQYWLIDGKRCRIGGPSEICWHPNGVVEKEAYHINGYIHREDGPALIWYTEDGKIDKQYWALNGEFLGDKHFDTYSYEMIEKMQAKHLFTIQELIKLKRKCQKPL